MADIPTFGARAPRAAPLQVNNDTGAADAWASLSRASGQISARLGQMADRAAVREGRDAGLAAGMSVTMPGVDFAYDGQSPATRVSGPPSGKLGELESYIRDAATKRGIDPDIAVKVARSEGLAPGVWQSTIVKNGKREPSYGPFQLYTGGGLGNEFEKLTGKKASDPSTVFAQIDFALDKATELGWSPWYGAAKVGVGARDGLASARALGMAGGAPAAPGTAPAAAPTSASVQVTLTGAAGALPQTRPGTLYGEAYNQAAMGVYANRADTAMRMQMDALGLQHQNDPAALDNALLALRAGFIEGQRPEVAARLDASFQTTRLGLQRQAAAQFNRDLEEQTLASFEENINSRITGALRIAAKGGYDGTADAALTFELDGIGAQIDGSTLSPLQKSRLKQSAAQEVWSARIMGGFDDLPDSAARATFANQLEADWQNGEGLGARLDQKSYDAVRNEMARRLQADEVAAGKRAAALDKSIDAQMSYLKKGWPVPAEVRDRLRQEVAATDDPALAANLDFMDGLAGWQAAHIAAPPAVLDAQIASLRDRIAREGITPAADATLDVMEGLRTEMDLALKTDPLTWADRAGVAKVEPIDFTDAGTLAASLSARTADAAAVAGHYGVEPKYFTPAERDGLTKMLKAAPLALPSIVSALSAGLGSDTPRALAEVSQDAPVLAHVAGLVHATGDQRVAVEIAEALELRRQPGYKSALPPAARMATAAAAGLDGALALLPATGNQVLETAAALLEARAFSRGIDMEEFATEGSPAREAFLEALDQTLGARTIGGVKHGGLTEVNGFSTVAPPDMPADKLQDLVDGLTADDMVSQAPMFSQNGIPVTPAQIRRGRLVMTAPGRYRVALGDIEAGDPRYVASPAGGYFELDAGALRRSQFSRRFTNRLLETLR